MQLPPEIVHAIADHACQPLDALALYKATDTRIPSRRVNEFVRYFDEYSKLDIVRDLVFDYGDSIEIERLQSFFLDEVFRGHTETLKVLLANPRLDPTYSDMSHYERVPRLVMCKL